MTTQQQSEQSTERTTESVVAAMLTERVGISFLDSGGTPQYDAAGNYVGSTNGYGRAFERNQRRDFANEPRQSLKVARHGIEFSRSVYHFLVENLSYDHAMQTQFDAFAGEPENERKSWLELMEEFVDTLSEQGREVTGLYRDGEPFTVNTYNHESALEQTLQYLYFEVDGAAHVLLQVHGGADARGGYTAPKAFTVDEESFMMDTDGEVSCDDCCALWLTQNGGSSWYPNGGQDSHTKLEDFDMVEAGEQEDGSTVTAGDEANKGRIVYGDGEPTCPCCGTGRLAA